MYTCTIHTGDSLASVKSGATVAKLRTKNIRLNATDYVRFEVVGSVRCKKQIIIYRLPRMERRRKTPLMPNLVPLQGCCRHIDGEPLICFQHHLYIYMCPIRYKIVHGEFPLVAVEGRVEV